MVVLRRNRLAAVLSLFLFTSISILAAELPPAPTTFLPLPDLEAYVDTLRSLEPSLIGPFVQIGLSVQGRPMRVVCVGACEGKAGDPITTLTGTPQSPGLFLTAMHHGREPMGALAILHFLRGLLTDYRAGNPSATSLLKSRHIFLLLCVNPDAYGYNVEHRASGGDTRAMARKNRKSGCTSSIKGSGFTYADVGVDLNRNYDFAFQVDNTGSSPDICAEDYRGSAPFSEPETSAIRDFMLSDRGKNLSIAVNWHSYARFINLPYAVQALPKPPADTYAGLISLAQGMATVSGYGYGHPWTGGLYTCNGEASDWMVAAAGVYAFSPEIGPQIDYEPFSSGMWPPSSLIQGILHEATPLTEYALTASGAFVRAHTRQATAMGTFTCSPDVSPCNHARVSVAAEVGNHGARGTVGQVVMTAIPASLLATANDFIDVNGGRVTSLSLIESIFSPVRPCSDGSFPVAAAPATAAAASSGRRMHNAHTQQQQPVIGARVLEALQTALRDIKPEERAERLDFRDVLAAEVPEREEGEVQEVQEEGESEEGAAASHRLLGDDVAPAFVAQTIAGWPGAGMSISTTSLGAFKKWASSSVGVEVEVDVDATTRHPPLDAHGNWAYLAISDESTCVIYGLPESQGETASMTMSEVHVGSTSCLPCAAFRRGPAGAAAPSPSPAAPTPTFAPSATPAAGGTGGEVSATSSPFPPSSTDDSWKDATIPPKANSGSGGVREGDGDGAASLWPWSTSEISAGSQVGLVFLGAVIGVVLTIAVARRLGVLPARRQPLVVVRTSAERSEEEEQEEGEVEEVDGEEEAGDADDEGDEVELARPRASQQRQQKLAQSTLSAGRTQVREASSSAVAAASAPPPSSAPPPPPRRPAVALVQKKQPQKERDSIEDGWSSDERGKP